MFMGTLTEASEGSVFNLTIGKKESLGNMAAGLAKEFMKKEMENQYKEILEVFGGNLAYWLLLLSVPTVRILWCNKTIAEAIWQLVKVQKIELKGRNFLKALDMKEDGSYILFQSGLYKGYEAALIWRNSIFINFQTSALEYTTEQEKILRYMAGYVPFSL